MPDHNKGSLRFAPNNYPGVWLMGLAAVAMVLLWLGGERITSLLQYRRSSILQGEYWRLVTGHVVHAGFRHLILNLAGAAIMAALFLRTYSLRQWTYILLASLIAIDLGFLLRDRDLETYVGLSGVLHGVLAAGTIAWWRTESRGLAIALTAITVGKLTWEQWQGPVSLAGEELVVIVNAHLYGAIAGTLIGGIVIVFRKLP